MLWRDFFYTVSFGTPNFDHMKGNKICKQVCWSWSYHILIYNPLRFFIIRTPFSLDPMEREWGAVCRMESWPDRIPMDWCHHDSGFPEKRATTLRLSCSPFSVSSLCLHHLQLLDHVNDFGHFLGFQLRKWGWIHHLARHSVACFLTRGDLVCMIYTIAWFMLFVCNFSSKLARRCHYSTIRIEILEMISQPCYS